MYFLQSLQDHNSIVLYLTEVHILDILQCLLTIVISRLLLFFVTFTKNRQLALDILHISLFKMVIRLQFCCVACTQISNS